MSSTTSVKHGESHRSLVPARMDRLPWTRFHWMIIVGLGVSWILDGLEIQIVSNAGFADEFHMDSAQVGLVGTVYLVGEVVGALVFGRLSDKLGRRKLFILTLFIYLAGSAIAGFSPAIWFLLLFRFVAGLGIGGEYAAINSAIDELIPSKYRGHVDIAINGTYWGGAALGAAANLVFLNTDIFDQNIGWRLAFFIGPILGVAIIFLRRHIPESPRWLMTHGHEQDAEDTVDQIESDIRAQGHDLEDVPDDKAIEVKATDSIPFSNIWRRITKQPLYEHTIAGVLLLKYPKRTLVGATMMITQSFLYNAIFFTYVLVLVNFYHVPKDQTPLYFFPFAIGNLLGPILLGRLFDTWGRRQMIFVTYVGSGLILAVSAYLFSVDALNATTQVIFWCAAFFLASAGASSAYLTVSEIFPLELRSQAISYFFALAQIFGSVAPLIFGILIGNGKHTGPLTGGYYLGAGIMILGGVIALIFGVSAARQGLESITEPLSIVKKGGDAPTANT